jgi:hypothetical protein
MSRVKQYAFYVPLMAAKYFHRPDANVKIPVSAAAPRNGVIRPKSAPFLPATLALN